MKARGVVLFELLVGALIALLLGSVLLQVFASTFTARSAITGQNVAATSSRQPLDWLADHLRNAWLYNNGTEYKVFSAATGNDLSYYINNNGDSIRYYLSNGELRRVEGGNTTVEALNITSLTFTYYKSAEYNSAAAITTADSHAPTAAELPLLSAVHIAATMNVDGFQSYYETLVRLRNSPRKLRV